MWRANDAELCLRERGYVRAGSSMGLRGKAAKPREEVSGGMSGHQDGLHVLEFRA